MKKLFLIFSLSVIVAFSACNNKTGEHHHAGEATHQHDSTSMEGATTATAYICPMKCEGSASDKPGKCPVCKMDLVAVEELQTTATDNK